MNTDYSVRTTKELKSLLDANAAEYGHLQDRLRPLAQSAYSGSVDAEIQLEKLTKEMGAVYGRAIFLKIALDAAKKRTTSAKNQAKERALAEGLI